MRQRHHGANRVFKLEAEPQIQDDKKHRVQNGPKRVAPQLRTHGRAYGVHALSHLAGIRAQISQRSRDAHRNGVQGAAFALGAFRGLRCGRRGSIRLLLGELLLDLAHLTDTNQELRAGDVLVFLLKQLHQGIDKPRAGQPVADILVGDVVPRIERDDHIGAGREIHAEIVVASDGEDDHADDYRSAADADRKDAAFHEPDFCIGADDAEHAQLGNDLALDQEVHDGAAHDERGEYTGADADTQGHGETFHGPAAELHEHRRRDQGRDIGVQNRDGGAIIAAVHRSQKRAAVKQFLADTFVDKHVRVHGHADRKDKARDARQGEGRFEIGQRGQQKQGIHDQRDVGHEPRPEVIHGHEHHHDNHAEDRREHASPDQVAAQACAYLRARLFDERHRHRTRTQRDREVHGLFATEITRDLPVSRDTFLDIGGGFDFAVDNDGERFADVLLGDLAHLRATGRIEAEEDHVTAADGALVDPCHGLLEA